MFSDTLPDPVRHADFYADIPAKRFGAWIVDVVLIWLMTAIVIALSAFVLIWLFPGIYAALSFIYRFAFLSRSSATPGMRLAGIELRDHRGRHLAQGTAMFHTLGHMASMALVLPQILSVGLILGTARHQGLTDHVLGTVAINRPARS
jgi:uncharacterized RDD family membrane protein YckC